MPTYNFTSPEGKTYKIEGPEGSTKAQAFQILQRRLSSQQPAAPAAAPAGPPAAAAPVAAPAAPAAPAFTNPQTGQPETQEERMARFTKQAALEPRVDPTGTTFENIAAGAGKSATGMIRGAKQLFHSLPGLGDPEELARLQAEEEEARKLDVPLMDTKAGKAGYYGTELASWLLPAAKATKIPGVVRLGRAAQKAVPVVAEAGLGGLQGALQATTKDESKLKNAALGATLGAALPASGAILRRAGDVGEMIPLVSGMVRGRRARVAGEERVARAAENKLASEVKQVEKFNANIDRQAINATRQQVKEEFKGRQKALLQRIGKGITTHTQGQRIAVPKAKVDALRSVARRHGENLPPEFSKLIDDMELASKHGFGKGEMLQQAKAALGDQARSNKRRGLPTTGLHEAERVISDTILAGLPKARADALRRTYSRYDKVVNAAPSMPRHAIPAKKAMPVAPDLSKPLAAKGLQNPYTRAAIRALVIPQGQER